MDVIDRIKMIIDNTGMTVASFARTLGFCDQTIRGIVVQRRNKPSFEILSKVIEAFPTISAEWLLTGRGEMINSKLSFQRPTDIGIKEFIDHIKEKDQIIERLIQENMTLKSRIAEL